MQYGPQKKNASGATHKKAPVALLIINKNKTTTIWQKNQDRAPWIKTMCSSCNNDANHNPDKNQNGQKLNADWWLPS